MDLTNLRLYHAAPSLLGEGSIIQPGNFGRIMSSYAHPGMPADDALNLARETVYELVRSTRYENLPSRLRSCFAFVGDGSEHAGFPHVATYLAPVLYEVEVVDPAAPFHLGDFSLINHPQNTGWLDATLDQASRYWAGSKGQITEFVTLSPLRVKRVAGHYSLSPLGAPSSAP